MITYNDLHSHRPYNTLKMDYNDEYEDATGPYYGNPHPVQDSKVLPQVTLASLGFSVQDVRNELKGINIQNYPDSLIEECISEAASWAEEVLDISIRPRVVKERDDYNKTDFMNYGYLRLDERPIIQIDDSRMIFNNNTVVKMPDEWIKSSNRYGFYRLQPTALTANTNGGLIEGPTCFFPTMNPNAGIPYGNPNYAPGLLGTTYIAGMLPRDPRDKDIQRDYYAPYTLIAMVDKLAAVYVLQRWGRTVLEPGIAGYGVSIDGISSNISSTQSASFTGSSADIKLLNNDIQNILKGLRAYYGWNLSILS